MDQIITTTAITKPFGRSSSHQDIPMIRFISTWKLWISVMLLYSIQLKQTSATVNLISSTGGSDSNFVAADLKQTTHQRSIISSKSPISPEEAESSTATLMELIDVNYLKVSNSDQRASQTMSNVDGTSLDQTNPSSIASRFRPSLAKVNGRHKMLEGQSSKFSDWWTELMVKNKLNKKNAGGNDSKFRFNDLPPDTKTYKEQPLSQNSILTLKNQLIAIKGKHRLLIIKSVPQLQRLDQKLVDSYKLCLKAKMPLYAGMLYRTRDFVTRMANEVKQERQTLEAMVVQVQKVLRQKMANGTIIKEFNRLQQQPQSVNESQNLLSTNQSPLDDKNGPLMLMNIDSSKEFDNLKPPTGLMARQSQDQDLSKQVVFGRTATNVVSSSLEQNHYIRDGVTYELDHGNQYYQLHNQQRNQHQYTRNDLDSGLVTATPNGTTNRPLRKHQYTVHINEVNLRKQLTKTQALIDRISISSHELIEVIDDIIYLFKLNNETRKGFAVSGKTNKLDRANGSNQVAFDGNMTQMELRKLNRMLKSPVKIFLEKFGKLTTNSPMNGNNSNSAALLMKSIGNVPTNIAWGENVEFMSNSKTSINSSSPASNAPEPTTNLEVTIDELATTSATKQ